MGPRYEIGGRAFVRARLTALKQDVYLSKVLIGAGLRDCSMQDGENLETYSLRILKQLLDADALLRCLSCLVVPENLATPGLPGLLRRAFERLGIVRRRPVDTGWSRAVAEEIEEFFGDLTDPADKDKVYELTAELLFPFFVNGTRSWASSLPSLRLNLAALGSTSLVPNVAPSTSAPGAT